METKTAGSLMALFTIISFMGGMTADSFMEQGGYYCEARNMVMPDCDNFTTYYRLENGKCINEQLGNKLCKSGWEWYDKIDTETINTNVECIQLIE